MSKINEIQGLIDKANDIQQGTTSKYRSFQEKFIVGKARIEKATNAQWRATGEFPGAMYDLMNDTFNRQMQRELMHLARDQKQQYRDAAAQAKKLSEEVIYANVPKPAQEQIDRFDRRLADIKTEIMLASPQKGRDLLREFIAGINEPYFAEKIRADYGELVTPILSAAGPDAARYKLELSQAFDEVKFATLTPEARQAVGMLESSEALLQSDLFGYFLEERVKEHFGPRVSELVNRPEAWFEANPDAAQILPGKLSEEESMMESVLTYQARAEEMALTQSKTQGLGLRILPPSPQDRFDIKP